MADDAQEIFVILSLDLFDEHSLSSAVFKGTLEDIPKLQGLPGLIGKDYYIVIGELLKVTLSLSVGDAAFKLPSVQIPSVDDLLGALNLSFIKDEDLEEEDPD